MERIRYKIEMKGTYAMLDASVLLDDAEYERYQAGDKTVLQEAAELAGALPEGKAESGHILGPQHITISKRMVHVRQVVRFVLRPPSFEEFKGY